MSQGRRGRHPRRQRQSIKSRKKEIENIFRNKFVLYHIILLLYKHIYTHTHLISSGLYILFFTILLLQQYTHSHAQSNKTNILLQHYYYLYYIYARSDKLRASATYIRINNGLYYTINTDVPHSIRYFINKYHHEKRNKMRYIIFGVTRMPYRNTRRIYEIIFWENNT